MHVASLVTQNGLSIFIDGRSHVVSSDHPNFSGIKQALAAKEYDRVEGLMDIAGTMREWVSQDGAFTLDGGLVVFEGEPFGKPVSDKVLRMIDDGFGPDALLNFLRKVRRNPSRSAQQELLLFCAAGEFLIHEDGDLLAYKSIRQDGTDVYTGTINNEVGQIVSMPRHQVDDRRDVTCSYGLHFASWSYASTFGSNRRVVVVKIDPADVVSIPSDYSNQKGRCCRYEVIAERTEVVPLPTREVYSTDQVEFPESVEDDEEDEDEERWDQFSIREEVVAIVDRQTEEPVRDEDAMDDLDMRPSDRLEIKNAIHDLFEVTVEVDADTTVEELIDTVTSLADGNLRNR